MIRTATEADLAVILPIYASARAFMRAHGNATQWVDGYPGEEMLRADIERGELYVMTTDQGHIYGVFMMHYGPDPTYRIIEGGSWHSEEPYATIHRIASDGTGKRIFHQCVEYAKEKYPFLRVDTHENNLVMQQAILREGFHYTGIIHLENGDPRFAYDYCGETDWSEGTEG